MTIKTKIANHKRFWKKTLVGKSIKKISWTTSDQWGSIMIAQIHLEDGTVLHLKHPDAIAVINHVKATVVK